MQRNIFPEWGKICIHLSTYYSVCIQVHVIFMHKWKEKVVVYLAIQFNLVHVIWKTIAGSIDHDAEILSGVTAAATL